MDIVDEFIEQLDAIWSKRPYNESGLRELLSMVPPELENAPTIRTELCASDLEWRWQQSKQRPHPKNDRSDAKVLPCTPNAHDYRDLLGDDLWNATETQSLLVLAEWRARSAFGDRPCLQKFLEQQSQHLAITAYDLQTILDEIAFVQVTVFKGTDKVISQRFPHRFVIGRQARGEPAPPAWLPTNQRLVVVDKSQASISREQILVDRQQVTEFSVANLSRKVSLDLDGLILTPGESNSVATPIQIVFGNITVAIDIAPN